MMHICESMKSKDKRFKLFRGTHYGVMEAYSVLVKKERLSRSYSRSDMATDLRDSDFYGLFLKECLDGDHTESMEEFRKGLYYVVKA